MAVAVAIAMVAVAVAAVAVAIAARRTAAVAVAGAMAQRPSRSVAVAVAVGGSGGRGRGGGRGGGRATGTDDDPFVVGISQKEKNKRQRENLARYPNLGFTHFVERTEFQGRGSAHGHALWWHPHAPTDAEDEEEDARGWRMRERDGCIAFVLVECDAEECARGACPRLCSSILM